MVGPTFGLGLQNTIRYCVIQEMGLKHFQGYESPFITNSCEDLFKKMRTYTNK